MQSITFTPLKYKKYSQQRLFEKFVVQLLIIPLFLFFILSSAYLSAQEKKTLCLNMIVKNESAVITRCLGSMKPIIDYWVIVDTGSTDGTQDIIRNYMKDIPGELHERPWKNFAFNRTEALELAKGKADYLVFIDADEFFRYDPNFSMPQLDKDLYYIMTEFGGTKYARALVVNNHIPWRWVGVLHEYLDSPQLKTRDTLLGITNIVQTDGARSQDPQKYHKDAALLEAALIEEPDNIRYVFYLAQSYRDAGSLDKSLDTYKKRVAMGGWDEEIYWSMFQIANISDRLNKPKDEITNAYLSAYAFRPTRAEALHRLSLFYRSQKDFEAGYQIAKKGIGIPPPADILFLEKWIHDYGMLLEYSICAYWTDRNEEALVASNLLLAQPDLPQGVRECVERNLYWINLKLSEAPKFDVVKKYFINQLPQNASETTESINQIPKSSAEVLYIPKTSGITKSLAPVAAN